jgi:pre-rRNA-processing protein TSR3
MQSFPPTAVIRHRLENLKKCSLRGLESRPDFRFYPYPLSAFPPIEHYIILTIEAPPLSEEDASHGLLILDATWRYAAKMLEAVQRQGSQRNLLYRSLPARFTTAYPRRQNDCPDPSRGLASIEAIYLSYQLLGRDTTGLLDNYYWKEEFIRRNI